MEEITNFLFDAESYIEGFLWLPKYNDDFFRGILEEISKEFAKKDIKRVQLFINFSDENMIKSFIDVIRKNVTEPKTLEKIAKERYVVRGIYKSEHFIPINFLSKDKKENLLFFPTDLDLTFNKFLKIETKDLREYLEIINYYGESVFDENGFNEDFLISALSNFKVDQRKKNIIIRDASYVNYRLGKKDYTLFMRREFKRSINKLEEFVKEHDSVLYKRFLYYANHDFFHVKTVLKNIIDLVLMGDQRDFYFRLNEVERFIIYLATILHDIGMGVDNATILKLNYSYWEGKIEKHFKEELKDGLKAGGNYEREAVRRYHAFISGEYIRQLFLNRITIESIVKKILNYVAEIAAAHSTKLNLSKIPTYEDVILGEEDFRIRSQLLAALLRFGDALDISYNRAKPTEAVVRNVIENDPSQMKHWAYKILIRRVSIEKFKGKLRVNVLFSSEEKYEKALILFEGTNLLKDVSTVIDILRHGGKIGDKELDIELNLSNEVKFVNSTTNNIITLKLEDLPNLQKEQEENIETIDFLAKEILLDIVKKL